MSSRDTAAEASRKGRPVQPGVSRGDLTSFDRTDAGRRIARLEADAALMMQLSAEGFDGRAWEKVSDALVEYGWQVMRAWIVTGQVFVKLREKGLPGLRSPPDGIPRDDALELAETVVADAIVHFRDHVLKPGKWDPTKGASLTTFFIGNCLRYQFPNLYRDWRKTRRQDSQAVDVQRADRRGKLVDHADPAGHVLNNVASQKAITDLLEPVTDPTNRTILRLRAEGYDLDEIAELLDMDYKSVESRIYRARKKLGRTTKDAS
jgi:DNA-binding CsgD family transcriptional regulator